MINNILDYDYRRYLILKNWKKYYEQVERCCEKHSPDCEFYVFGNVVEKKLQSSDRYLDCIKVCTKNWSEKIDLKLKIEDDLNIDPNLIELHL